MDITIKHKSFVMQSNALVLAILEMIEALDANQQKEDVQAKSKIRTGVQHAKDCVQFLSYLAMSIKLYSDKDGFIFRNIEMSTINENGVKKKLRRKDSEELGIEHFNSFEEDLLLGKTTIYEVRETLKALALIREKKGRFARQVLFSLDFENVKKLYESVGDTFEYVTKTENKDIEKQTDTVLDKDEPKSDLSNEFEGNWEGDAIEARALTQSLSNYQCDANGIILPSKNKAIGEKGIKQDQDRYDQIYAVDHDGDRVNGDDFLKSITMGKPTQISTVYYSIKSHKKEFTKNLSETPRPSIYKGQAGI